MQIKKYVATKWYCSGCVQLQKLIDALPDEIGSQIESVDIDTVSRQDLGKLKIRGVPVMVAFDDEGNEIGRLTGVPTKSVLEEFIRKYS